MSTTFACLPSIFIGHAFLRRMGNAAFSVHIEQLLESYFLITSLN
jgi:hypothetical protein